MESEKALATAQAEMDKYSASLKEGIQPPADVVKKYEKAAANAREDRYHADTAKKAAYPAATAKPTPKPTPQPEVPTEQIEAMKRPGAPKPAATPENVKTPGQIRPERTAAEEPLQEKPQVPVGQRQLPNAQGTVGTQKLLTRPELPVEAPAAGTEPTPDWKTKEPAAEVKSEYPEFPMVRPGEAPAAPKAGMPQMKLPEEAPKSGIPQMTDEAALRALEAKEGKVVTNPKKLVGEQLKEALKPGEAPKANEPAAPKAKETPKVEEKKEPVMERGEEGREPAKSAAEYHPAVEQKVNELSDDKLRTLAKAHGLNPDEYDFKARDEGRHRVERDQLAKDITAQMGDDEKINLGRAAEQTEKQGLFQGADTSAKGRASRAEKMFPRLRGPVDEYGNPKVAGGAPDTVGTKEAADKDTEHFANAKKELGDKASISDVAKRAQEIKDVAKTYAGEERRGVKTPEMAYTGSERRNPFQDTEKSKETIAKDKNMPVHPAEEAKAATKADNYHGEPMTYEHHPMGEQGGNQQHHVITKDANGRKIGELVAQDTKSGVATVRSNQIYDEDLQGKGRGTDQITHFLNNVGKDIHTVHSDISTSKPARGAWDKLEKAYPDSVTKKTYKDGQIRYTVDMDRYNEERKK